MAKTVSIPDEAHNLIVDKQLEIRRKHKVHVRISDILYLLTKHNIDKLGEYLGLKSGSENKSSEQDENMSNIEKDKKEGELNN